MNLETPEFTLEETEILQILLEQIRGTVIIKEFIITTKFEIIEAINNPEVKIDKLYKELNLYGLSYSEPEVYDALAGIDYTIKSLNKIDKILIGFGGLNAITGPYK